jgi:Spy/CpxP family protein refolding chaperone
MRREAVALGEQFLRHEVELERMFADRQANEEPLKELTERAALAGGRLRAVHLRYHLEMMELLTPAQVEAYGRLRGYTGSKEPSHQSR